MANWSGDVIDLTVQWSKDVPIAASLSLGRAMHGDGRLRTKPAGEEVRSYQVVESLRCRRRNLHDDWRGFRRIRESGVVSDGANRGASR